MTGLDMLIRGKISIPAWNLPQNEHPVASYHTDRSAHIITENQNYNKCTVKLISKFLYVNHPHTVVYVIFNQLRQTSFSVLCNIHETHTTHACTQTHHSFLDGSSRHIHILFRNIKHWTTIFLYIHNLYSDLFNLVYGKYSLQFHISVVTLHTKNTLQTSSLVKNMYYGNVIFNEK
jgi:hypothetical protein